MNSCVSDKRFDIIEKRCDNSLSKNATYAEIKEMFKGVTLQIQEDLIIEGYINSSDEQGNFFGVLHFQDKPINPTAGFQIEIDVRDSHLFYPEGSKIYIKLKDLYLGKSKGAYKIGGAFSAFGNVSVGRLPSAIVSEHVILACEENSAIEPDIVSIKNLQQKHINALIRLDSIQFTEEDIDLPYAIQEEQTERFLEQCNGDEIVLLNSGYSDFYEAVLPSKNGSITGILTRDNQDYKLVIRSTNDIQFYNERCNTVPEKMTTNSVFISEIADPNNNAAARFVELYNASENILYLNGWQLQRFTNASLEVSSSIDLTRVVIPPESTFVISPNATEFEIVYGFQPNMGVDLNSPADSNGDDNLVLVDPFQTIIDVFGVVGEDGTGTNHEFEDGRAVRNVKIKAANAQFKFDEWRIFNDTGGEQTMNVPQNAPDDFTPGIRN